MKREQMIEVVSELIDILNEKKISPNDAEGIARIFEKAVMESNEIGKKTYMYKGLFIGSPPEE